MVCAIKKLCCLTEACICCSECAVKFNDYFEFPRQLDMMPYTVQGLAKLEGLLHIL